MPGATFNCSARNLFRCEAFGEASAARKMNAAGHIRTRRHTIIPSKLNRKSKNYLPAAPSIYAEGATNALETSHNHRARYPLRRTVMLRKTVLALLAAVT